VKAIIDFYLENARIMNQSLTAAGFTVFGGVNAPYVWVKTKNNMKSWEFFDLLLEKAGVVCTPGAGFGKCGQGFIRISAFNSFENVRKAMSRIKEAKLF